MEEWDPRFTRGAANFYHDQEDILWKYCKEQDVNWSITMPMTGANRSMRSTYLSDQC